MPSLSPGEGLKLTESQLSRLGGAVHERVVDLESDHAKLFRDIPVWWDWYNAKPRFERKDFPFKDASNVIVPVIQWQSMALVNRLLGMIFGSGDEIWMPRTENTDNEKVARDVVRGLNRAANNDFDFRTPITDWLNELVPIGSSVIALNWSVNEYRMVVGSGRSGDLKTRSIVRSRGPLFEHVPRTQMLWNTRYAISKAPLIVRELQLFWSEVNAMATNEREKVASTGWILENLDSVRGAEGLHGASADLHERTARRDGVDENRQPHDFREVHLDWPTLSRVIGGADIDEPNEEDLGTESACMVVTYHYETQKIVRVRAEPYQLPGKPFFDGYYRKQPGKNHGVGLCKDLFAMQDAATVLFNQGIDSRTRANSFWAKTDRRELISKVVDPRYPVYVPPGAMFEPLKFEGNVLQDQAMFNLTNIITERLTGQADPVMGRESRSGGHPSPATSTLALLGQSDQMIGSLRMQIRQRIGQMGEAAALLYQQFETNEDGHLQRIFGVEDAANIEQFLFPQDPAGGPVFDVVGMSQSQNPQQELAKWIQITQMNVNYWGFVSNAIQQVAQAQQIPGLGPIIAQVGQMAIKAQSKLQERLLEAGNVDDIENFTLQLQGANTGNSQALLGVANQLGGLASGPGAAGQPSVGGPPVGIPGGAPPQAGSFNPGYPT